MMSRRFLVGRGLALVGAYWASRARAARTRDFPVERFGARGDGMTLDTAAIQRAIDAAAAVGGGARVVLRGGRRYLTGALTLRGGIDFHLARGAVLLISIDERDYAEAGPALEAAGISARGVALRAFGADDLTISGTGSIDGRSPAFMERYDATDEWWIPKPFRPRLLVLENCARLAIRDVNFLRAPSWTVHLLGCRDVRIERVTIRNQRDVPNCDGIDPDHCQNVDIRNCHIVCGDDAIVLKTTAGHDRYGPCHNIRVRDCVLETQDSGIKIGTETNQDIFDVRFERCRIVTACRGLTIQLRDGGSVHDIVFRDIRFAARHFSAPWWGRGEAISFTAIPRSPATRVGTIRNVLVQDVTGTAENSVRIEGLGGARVSDITLERVSLRFGRSTRYPGGVFDNRPTTAIDPLEAHATPAISVRHADRVTLIACTVQWAPNPADEFTHALEAVDVTALDHRGLSGDAAHPGRDPAVVVR